MTPRAKSPERPLLEIRDLRVEIEDSPGAQPIVRGIDLEVNRGEVLALIGESGSGKTTICLAALGYFRPGLKLSRGTITLDGTDVLALDGPGLRDLRGRQVAYVAQSAAASFNPGLNIDYQVTEPALVHGLMNRTEAGNRALALYRQLKLPGVERIGRRFPHQVSGGQLQRLMAAMAMCAGPRMLVFDEPTTALDVTTQINVLQAFKEVIREQGVAAIYVTHDLAVVAQIADRIIVLLNGQIQEQGATAEIIERPRHDYTRVLMAASDIEKVSREREADRAETEAATGTEVASKPGPAKDQPLLEVSGLTAGYGGLDKSGSPAIPILEDIELTLPAPMVLGVIGESGSGKTTLGRVIAGLLPLARGLIRLEGRALNASAAQRSREELRRIQMVFQMADTALNPAHTIGKILGRPVEYFQGASGAEKKAKVARLLDMVQLPADFVSRRPDELSGGQKQRVNLARALAAEPSLVICDEVTSGLDTVVRMAIIELIKDLHRSLGVSFIFISHDISTIASLASEVMVMYRGRIVEQGPIKEVLERPAQAYTQVLMASVPHLRLGWLDEAIARRENVLEANQGLVLAD